MINADVLWIILAIIAVTSVLVIASAALTGVLVLRAKREVHEPLFGPKQRERPGKPINIDEFASPDPVADDDVLPESISLQNKIFGSVFAKENIKDKS